jgi:hypothetical protein
MSEETALIPVDKIERAILQIRGQKILLDEDLAELYGVETKVLNQAVRRNLERFPEDFMFQLTTEEWKSLRSQIVTLKGGRGQHRKYRPYAFTEQGVAMLSGVLNSPRAILVNIEIMRAFVRLRHMLAAFEEIFRRLDQQERKVDQQERQIQVVFEVLGKLHQQLTGPVGPLPGPRLGFRRAEEEKSE